MRAIPLFFFLLLAAGGSTADRNLAEAMDLYHHGKFQRAVEVLSQKNTSAPESVDVHLWLGKAYLKLQKWDDAIREMEKALQIDPSNSMCHLWLGRAFGGKAEHVSFFTAPGWARKVMREFEAAVKLSPRNLDARFDLLEFYVEAPGIIGGGRDKAEAQAKEIAAINPRQGYTARARIYERDRKWDGVRRELTRATTEFPDDAGGFVDLADFLLDQADYSGAESNARNALRLDGNDLRAKLILGAAAVGLRSDVAEAEKSLAEMSAGPLRDTDPAFQEVYYWLGRAYQEQGKISEARQAYQTTLRFDPDYEAAKSALSRIH